MNECPVNRKTFDRSYAITLAAVFYAGIASGGLSNFTPLIVGALIDDYHFTSSQAGFVAGIEMAGIGISAMLVASLGGDWNRRLIVLAGATLGVLGSVVPVLMGAYIPILLSRLIAGIGCGFIASIVLAVIGTTRDPDRTFGFYYISTFVSSSLLMPACVWMLARFHVAGGFILIALLLGGVYFTAPWFPETFAGLRDNDGQRSLPPFPMRAAIWSLGLSLLFWIGFGGLWAFVERFGVQAGLARTVIGGVLSLGPLASIAGAATASALHTRLGRSPPLAVAIGLAAMSASMLGWGSTIAVFTLAVFMFSFAWPLFLAYLGGAMSTLDPAGRIIAMSVTSQTIGMAVGPAIAGVIARHFGYEAITVLELGCFAVALVLLAPLVVTLRGDCGASADFAAAQNSRAARHEDLDGYASAVSSSRVGCPSQETNE